VIYSSVMGWYPQAHPQMAMSTASNSMVEQCPAALTEAYFQLLQVELQ